MERMYRQAWETIFENLDKIKDGDTINPFNKSLNKSGISPSLTTRPDGFKTAILVVSMVKENEV